MYDSGSAQIKNFSSCRGVFLWVSNLKRRKKGRWNEKAPSPFAFKLAHHSLSFFIFAVLLEREGGLGLRIG